MSKIVKGIRNPEKVVPYLKWTYCTVEGSIVFWPWRGQVAFESFRLPRPGPDEVLVQNYMTLVSPGTERAFFNHLPNANTSYPFYPGYSGAGQVIMTGKRVTRFTVGDRVALRSGHASMAIAKENQVFSIPDTISLRQAAFLQLTVIALQGVRKARLRIGDSVAILGQGLVGQLVTQLAAASGAHPVIAVASSDRRREMSTQSGAHVFVSLQHERDRLNSLEIDTVIEVSGNPAAIPLALQCIRPGGRIVLLGSTRGACREVDLQLLEQKRLSLSGAHIDSLPERDMIGSWWPSDQEVHTFWDLLESRRLKPDVLVSDQIFPPEAEWFYRRLSRGDSGILASLFRWDMLSQRNRAYPRSFLVSVPGIQENQDLQPTSDICQLPSSALALPEPKHALYEGSKEKIMPGPDGALKVGLIGCGEIAIRNARAVSEAPNAVISMVMDVQEKVAKDLGEKYRAPFTISLDELLASNIDAVLISVPHYLHAPLAIQSIEAGKHVMIEKPMALTTEEAASVVEAAQKAKVKLSTIYCQRYQPHVQRAKKLMLKGALGRVLGVSLFFQMDKPASYWTGGYTGRVMTDWRASKAKSGGGIFIFSMVHYLDIIHYLTGLKVTRVFSEYDVLDSPVETEDTISITLRYDNQAIGVISASTCVRGVKDYTNLQIWGIDGHLRLEKPFEFFSLRQVEGYEPSIWHVVDDLPIVNDRTVFVTRFADAVLTGVEPDILPEDNMEIQSIVDAVYQSAKTQHPVELFEL